MDKFLEDWCLPLYFYSGIDDPKINEDFEKFKTKCDSFINKYKGKLEKLSNELFLEYLEESDNLQIEETRIAMYFELLISSNNLNQTVQKQITKYEKLSSEYFTKLTFCDEELKHIGKEVLLERSKLKMFEPFKNYLITSANDLGFLLKPEEEKIYITLSNASSTNLYEEMTSSFKFEYNGKELTESEIFELRFHKNRQIRKKAFEIIASVFGKDLNQIVLGNLYSIVCKQNVVDVELRKYKSVMTSRNISEDVSDSTVNKLIDVVKNNYSLYHKFLKKKTALLGLEKLHVYDVLCSLNNKENSNQKYSFRSGWKVYKDTISKVDPALAKFSEDMLVGGRMSIFPKPGKTSGAFAQYSKHTEQFVLLNWTDSINDVFTMAHELGHAFHGHLSKAQKEMVYNSPLILAETASIFNETLMFETLLKETTDKQESRKLICDRLNDIFATIFKQIAYTIFEKRCHESFLNNQPLSYQDYNEIWVEEMKKLYGKHVEVESDLIQNSWSSISHIFQTPFYCYTYAFGNIISLNLYQNYKNTKDKKMFIKKYHKLLSAGGSDSPENLLYKFFKIKFNDKFYKTAFDNIEDLILKLK